VRPYPELGEVSNGSCPQFDVTLKRSLESPVDGHLPVRLVVSVHVEDMDIVMAMALANTLAQAIELAEKVGVIPK
jgi:hypothetical protein